MRNYATQMDAAKRGIVTPEIETVAKKENRPVEFIMERVAKGTIAIPANINHKSLSAEAVGDCPPGQLVFRRFLKSLSKQQL